MRPIRRGAFGTIFLVIDIEGFGSVRVEAGWSQRDRIEARRDYVWHGAVRDPGHSFTDLIGHQRYDHRRRLYERGINLAPPDSWTEYTAMMLSQS